MHKIKTEVEHIYAIGRGVFENLNPTSTYELQREKAIMSFNQNERINRLESKVSEMTTMLEQILKKVSE